MTNSESLYLIVPYFNFNNSIDAEESLNDFLNQALDEKVKIVLVQGLLNGQTKLSKLNNIYLHLIVNLPDKLWVQNNLINYGISQLPPDWKYLSWCDRDIIFCDKHWSDKTLTKLNQNVDILQPFSDCFHLNREGAIDYADQQGLYEPGFGRANCFMITSFCKHFKFFGAERDRNIFRHTGHIWAARREFFEKTGGRLFDKAFLGAADIVLSSSIKQVESKMYSKIFGKEYENYFNFFKNQNINVDYCDGVILHRNHGSIKSRQYNSRYSPFLNDPHFNLELDVDYSDDKILKITNRGKRFAKYIDNYFSSRD
jgi:hypothetical protein